MQGKLQITGCEDKKGDGCAGKYVQHGYPEGIGLREDQGTFPAQVEGFAAVGHHYQEAGGYPQPVEPDFPLGVVVRHSGQILKYPDKYKDFRRKNRIFRPQKD